MYASDPTGVPKMVSLCSWGVEGTLVYTTNTTQAGVPATSSGEAEVRALTHCAQICVCVKILVQENFGLKIDTPRIRCDSSAALQAATA